MSTTLLELRTQSRQRADMENSQFVSDSELNSYINKSIAELHDLLISCYDSDYYMVEYPFQTTVNVTNYALPADFYKLRGVDLKLQGQDYYSVRPFNFNERNRNLDLQWGLIGGPSIRYRMIGSNMVFSPKPDGAYDCRLWYTPTATVLVTDSSELADLNQYSEYVIVDAAIKMMQKEESDVSVLMAQKQALASRIVSMAQNRDAGQPESISDIYAENNDFYFFRGNS